MHPFTHGNVHVWMHNIGWDRVRGGNSSEDRAVRYVVLGQALVGCEPLCAILFVCEYVSRSGWSGLSMDGHVRARGKDVRVIARVWMCSIGCALVRGTNPKTEPPVTLCSERRSLGGNPSA